MHGCLSRNFGYRLYAHDQSIEREKNWCFMWRLCVGRYVAMAAHMSFVVGGHSKFERVMMEMYMIA
jgi:hypothetical protein